MTTQRRAWKKIKPGTYATIDDAFRVVKDEGKHSLWALQYKLVGGYHLHSYHATMREAQDAREQVEA